MNTWKRIIISLIVLFAIKIAVSSYLFKKNRTVEDKTNSKPKLEVLATSSDYSGNYVTEEYKKRSEGYDWLALKVLSINDDSLLITIRARNDRKKPTCTFEGVAKSVSKNMYEAINGENSFLINFNGDKALIRSVSESDKDKNTLLWFCSGGASLADYTFRKLSENLDETQLNRKN